MYRLFRLWLLERSITRYLNNPERINRSMRLWYIKRIAR